MRALVSFCFRLANVTPSLLRRPLQAGTLPPVVIHAFTGTEQELAAYRQHDFYIGVTGMPRKMPEQLSLGWHLAATGEGAFVHVCACTYAPPPVRRFYLPEEEPAEAVASRARAALAAVRGDRRAVRCKFQCLVPQCAAWSCRE